jgi:hypothetical protein
MDANQEQKKAEFRGPSPVPDEDDRRDPCIKSRVLPGLRDYGFAALSPQLGTFWPSADDSGTILAAILQMTADDRRCFDRISLEIVEVLTLAEMLRNIASVST